MAEPGAIIPVDAGLRGSERHRCRRLGSDLHVDAVVRDAEAVGQILDLVDVGDVDGDLVALLDREVLKPEGRRGRRHVDAHLVAIADHLRILLQRDAVGLGLLDSVREEWVIALPEAHGIDLGPVHECRVVRLRKTRAVMHDHHAVARNVDQLIVLRLKRSDVQESVL